MKKPYLKKNNEQGFSLVEFIVVLVIFSIMSGTSLFNFNQYQNNIQTTNIAQDIALTIRQAQVYGISGSDRVVGDGDIETNDAANLFADGGNIENIAADKTVRGVAINTGSQEIIIFEDLNRDFKYAADDDRVIDVRKVLARNTNISVCLFDFNVLPDPDNCSEEVISDNDDLVTIVFQRPYPDAFIQYAGNDYGHVFIELKDNSANKLKYVEISPIGNISVRSYE